MSTTTRTAEAEEVVRSLFMTAEGRIDPYPHYHRLRELAPVHYSDTARAWLLSRYEDCFSALRDPRLGKDFVDRMDLTRPWWRERPSLARAERSMLNVDGPYHTRLRRLVSKVFTFRSVEKLRGPIERMVDDLFAPLAHAGGGDLIADLAFPLPITVIGELLGVPRDDREQFRDLVRDITAVFEPEVHREQFDVADEATRVVDAYFSDLIATKRAHPTDDLLSRLTVRDDDGESLDDEELITMATLLFAAGFETTTNLVGNAMVGFLRDPGEMDVLRAEPALYAELPPEVLRYDGTAQMAIRQATDAYEIDGFTISPGDSVLVMLAAGNHDPSRYTDPDRIDARRTDVKPLSFGGGIHFCLGAALATAEIEIVFAKLFERFDVIEPDGDIPVHRDRLTLRGMASLPLILRSTGRPAAAPARNSRDPAKPQPSPRKRASVPGLPSRPSGDDTKWRAAFRRHVEATAVLDAAFAETTALLHRVPFFAACTPDELCRLARTAYAISFEAGHALCVEGADAGECYVIAEGEATVSIGGSIVASVGADDVVGEKGPIERRPRAATVTATTHVIAYAISRDHLQELVDASPAAARAMRDLVRVRYSGS